MTFTLDTSGVVEGPISAPDGQRFNAIGWAFLSPFAQGYVEAMFAALEQDRFCDNAGQEPWLKPYPGFSDLAPETLALILRDCETALAPRLARKEDDRDGGSNFWALRQRGIYPDRRYQYFPPLTPYLGDDGKVYLRQTVEA